MSLVLVILIFVLSVLLFFSLIRLKKCNWEKIKSISNIFAIPLTGIIVSLIISDSQNENAKSIAINEQKLFALQIFSDKLTGNRIDRELTINLIESLNDTSLAIKLRDISNKITIEKLKDSIWSKTEKSRIDAIIEYAKLYKYYPELVIDALLPRYKTHLENWEPMISISQFFTLLYKYSGDSIWVGTKEDSISFATIRGSFFYKEPEKAPTPNVHVYLERGLNNFRERK